MLPTSKKYLTRAGLSARVSAFALIGLFLAGVIAIRIVSGLLHHYIPSHVVDCDHTHEQDSDTERGTSHSHHASPEPDPPHKHAGTNGSTEHTPLLRGTDGRSFKSLPVLEHGGQPAAGQMRKGTLFPFARGINLLMGDVKPLCDENGPCFGFSQACGYECTKTLTPKGMADEGSRPLLPQHQSIAVQLGGRSTNEEAGSPQTVRHVATETRSNPPRTISEGIQRTGYFETIPSQPETSTSSSQTDLIDYRSKIANVESGTDTPKQSQPAGGQHHHHVPQNAFLSIGLQTVLAIALHKLPEGFITYATNHANPTLGMTVFLALFIHNISEGFAMALPLYLALYSRWKAIVWSSLLGGISQPAGAGLAALWIWGSQKAGGHSHDVGPSWGVYGAMFAATAGVMTSVALQLLSEGLGLTHNRSWGIGFAIAGMGIMGLSFALTS